MGADTSVHRHVLSPSRVPYPARLMAAKGRQAYTKHHNQQSILNKALTLVSIASSLLCFDCACVESAMLHF